MALKRITLRDFVIVRELEAPQRTPVWIAWSVAVSQACSAIMMSIDGGTTVLTSPCSKRRPSRRLFSAEPAMGPLSRGRRVTFAWSPSGLPSAVTTHPCTAEP